MKFRALILFLLASLLLVSCSGSKYSKIKDPKKLQDECTALFKQFDETKTPLRGSGTLYEPCKIPREKWPDAIKALNPVAVNRGRWGVDICTGGDVRQFTLWGYYVFIDPTAPPVKTPNSPDVTYEDLMTFVATETSGIYQYTATVTLPK